MCEQSGGAECSASARVDRKHEGNLLADLCQRLHDRRRPFRVVDVAGAVQRDEAVVSRHAQARSHRARIEAWSDFLERIDHGIPHEMDAIGRASLVSEVVDSLGTGHEVQIGERVGHDAIDLLRHAPIEAPQSGFDVSDGDVEFRCSEGCSERRVDIAIDHDAGRIDVHERLLKRFEETCRQCPVTASSQSRG